jgi:lipoprotein-anchoring transpeptidase ErfK/SrfK
MYFFENGNLFKDYNVSTGLNYPTPVGSYKIKNKLPIGFSAIFNVWMPWWMAFEYAEDIGAYLGIHELPYKLVGGEKIYRFGNYIGNRKTGGCVALAPGDAKEVYDKSYPGMDVVIFK